MPHPLMCCFLVVTPLGTKLTYSLLVFRRDLPGEIPDPVGPPSLFADSPEIPGWFVSEQMTPARDLMGFQSSLSPINSIPSGDSGERQSSSSSVASDGLDGDVGLLTSLLSLPPVGSMTRASVSSDFVVHVL